MFFGKNEKLFFAPLDGDEKTLLASGAAHGMLSGDAREAEHALAMRAFAEDVGLSVTHSQGSAAEGQKKLSEKAAEGGVLRTALCKIAREQTEDTVAEGDKIQRGKDIAQSGVAVKNPAKEDGDKGKGKEEVIESIGTVSARKKMREAIAEAALARITHGGILS